MMKRTIPLIRITKPAIEKTKGVLEQVGLKYVRRNMGRLDSYKPVPGSQFFHALIVLLACSSLTDSLGQARLLIAQLYIAITPREQIFMIHTTNYHRVS